MAWTGVALILTGCAGPPDGGRPSGGAATGDLECSGTTIGVEAYADAEPASDATGVAAEAIASAVDDAGVEVAFDDPGAWLVVEASSAGVTLLRPYAEPSDVRGIGVLDDHELRVIAPLGDEPWMLGRAASCALSRDPDPLAPADVALDETDPPSPDDESVSLLVTERACNGGRDAAGRVRLVHLAETDEAVTVWAAVEPEEGDASCPSNPPTPFTVDLAEPLGDREILDGSLATPRPIQPYGEAAD